MVVLVFLISSGFFFLRQFFGLPLLVCPLFLFLLRRLSSFVNFKALTSLLGAFNLDLLGCFCPFLLNKVLLFCGVLIVLHEVGESRLSFWASGILFLDLAWPVVLRRRHSEARFSGICILIAILMHRLIVLNMRIVGLRVVHHSVVLRVGRRTRVDLRLLSHAEVIERHGRHVRGINRLHGLNWLNGLNIPDVAHIGLQVVSQPLRHWIPLPRVIILSSIQTMLARMVLLQKAFLTTLSVPHLNRRVGPVGAIGLHLLHVPLDIHSFLLIDPHQKYL